MMDVSEKGKLENVQSGFRLRLIMPQSEGGSKYRGEGRSRFGGKAASRLKVCDFQCQENWKLEGELGTESGEGRKDA